MPHLKTLEYTLSPNASTNNSKPINNLRVEAILAFETRGVKKAAV